MNASLQAHSPARPNQTRVRQSRRSLDGGRPTDLRILGFEAAFEAIVVETDDVAAIEAARLEIQRAGGVQSQIIMRLTATRRIDGTVKMTESDTRVLYACRNQLSKVLEHLRSRIERLRESCIPEEQRIARVFDDELSHRSACGGLS
jgi:hypothetical protein